MIDDEEESATMARWVLPAGRRRATYPHPNTIARDREERPPRRYGDGVLALGTAQTRRAGPPPIPAPRPPRPLPRASTAPASEPASERVEAAVAPEPVTEPATPADGDRAAWRWLAVLTAIAAVLVVGAVAYAIVVLGLVAP